jgi:tetratricopeptide (TPR) repeat protein
MRWLVFFCSVIVTVIWFAPERVVASSVASSEVDPQNNAQALEEALRAVEWYTNESVRKALQAEAIGDIANAKLFGDKAIESDKKAQGLRSQAAAAWLAANKLSDAKAVWQRAAVMAEERAVMLANRVPSLLARWEAVRRAVPLPVEAHAETTAGPAISTHEAEIAYLQAVFFTAQQWAVAADFYTRAEELDKAAQARKQLQSQLPLLSVDRLQILGNEDVRLKDTAPQVQAWLASTSQ